MFFNIMLTVAADGDDDDVALAALAEALLAVKLPFAMDAADVDGGDEFMSLLWLKLLLLWLLLLLQVGIDDGSGGVRCSWTEAAAAAVM